MSNILLRKRLEALEEIKKRNELKSNLGIKVYCHDTTDSKAKLTINLGMICDNPTCAGCEPEREKERQQLREIRDQKGPAWDITRGILIAGRQVTFEDYLKEAELHGITLESL